MKSLTRTIIVLAVFNLVMGSFALAQAGGSVPSEPEPTRPTPARPTPAPPTRTRPTPAAKEPPSEVPVPAEPAVVPAPGPVVPTPAAPPVPAFTISGTTRVSRVMMQGLPGNPVSDVNGIYMVSVPYGWTGTVTPKKEGYAFEPPNLRYRRVTRDLTNQNYSPKRIGPAPILGRAGGRKVLVIPATDVEAEDLVEITQDLQVMSHIFDERFKEPRLTKGLFTDFGDFFGRDSRETEAIYMQGYGALFLMEVNFAFSPPPKAQEKEAEKTEDVDPIWQRARQKIFSPKFPGGDSEFVSDERDNTEKIDQLKTELVKTLKHAANIRNLTPDEWVILTVIGQGRQPELLYRFRYFGERTGKARGRAPSSERPGRGTGMSGTYGGMGSYGGGGYGTSGYGMGGRGAAGYGGGMMGGYGSGMMGGYGSGMMEGYGEMGAPSATVLTIRAKKSDVDDFANYDDFEVFSEKVQIFTY